MGLSPDMIVTRGGHDLTEVAKQKIIMFCDVPANAVFSLPDLETVLEAPSYLDKQGLGSTLNLKLRYEDISADWTEQEKLIEKFLISEPNVNIAITGKYTELADSYISVKEALQHAAAHNKVNARINFISTEEYEINPDKIHTLNEFDGILVPGGFGSRGAEGKIAAIHHARENSIPFLGICYGFQLAVIEFARNVCNLKDANTTEISKKTEHPVIDLLPEQKDVEKKGGTMRLGKQKIMLKTNTIFRELYQASEIFERHRHRYEVNPEYIEKIEKQGLTFSGRSEDGRKMETLEIKDHPCFIATQFHPEFQSRPEKAARPFFIFIKSAKIRLEQRKE
jgi:CTP synthase